MSLSSRLAIPVVVFYSLGYPLGALAVQAMSPGPVMVLRFALSAPVLLAISAFRGVSWPRGRMLHVAIVGLLIQAVQFIASYWAMDLGLSPVLLALTVAMNPLATAVLAAVLLGERVSRRKLIALALAVIAVLIAFAGRLGASGGVGVGLAGAVIALLGLSFGGVYQQRHVRGVDPILGTAIGLTASLPPALVFALSEPIEVHRPRQAVLSVAAMVLFSSLIGMSLYFAALRSGGASQVAMLFAVIPSGAALLSWLLLGERPDVGVVIGLVVGAVACVIGRDSPPRLRSSASDRPTLVRRLRIQHLPGSAGLLPDRRPACRRDA
ncbi:DMT family transporter [Flexivirga meconopsidis]|uniref:DMT family transporter n=1 Tax=Flexivirga meconopsidis TaxID=2977121 RepID=UPI00224009C4|nr:DMT family transporter [Flexivirga meconopsidis]